MAFMVGLVAGVWVFADAWVRLEGFVTSGALETATLADLLGVPFWAIAVAVAVIAVLTFRLIGAFEARRAPLDVRAEGKDLG